MQTPSGCMPIKMALESRTESRMGQYKKSIYTSPQKLEPVCGKFGMDDFFPPEKIGIPPTMENVQGIRRQPGNCVSRCTEPGKLKIIGTRKMGPFESVGSFFATM